MPELVIFRQVQEDLETNIGESLVDETRLEEVRRDIFSAFGLLGVMLAPANGLVRRIAEDLRQGLRRKVILGGM